MEVQPDFALPEYRGLPAKRESGGVTDEDVARAIEALRERSSGFNIVDRAVQAGDFVVVTYTGTCPCGSADSAAGHIQQIVRHPLYYIVYVSQGDGDCTLHARRIARLVPVRATISWRPCVPFPLCRGPSGSPCATGVT